MKRLSLGAVLFLASCQSDRPFPKVLLGHNVVEPIWSSSVGCSGGIEFGTGTISVARRIGNEYETWRFDAASGMLIRYAMSPARIGGRPNDTPADLTAGSTKPLDTLRLQPLTPPGFTPVVLTDRFLFAKRARTQLRRFQVYSEGQVVVIDRPGREVVWMDEGVDIAVLATSGLVIVCRDGQTSIFTENAGRPTEVSAFYAAVHAANLSAVRKLYPIWRRSGMRDVDGKVPLSIAAKDGHLDIVKALVELGETPNSVDADGFNPLMMSLHWNHADIAEFLLDAGAMPTDGGPTWGSVLRIAVHEKGRTIVNRLLRAGGQIDAVETWSGRTALHEAVMYRNYEAIEALISAGANVKARDRDGKTPRELASTDRCITHLFTGGLIKDEPTACQPIKHETETFDPAHSRR